ncbi:siderophore-interacting protein [Microbacterium sp.]|uniref:siderophore-interacting protein n=1 Tax=Microbacterium sp. TaxID=51671 RepID=UPI00391CEF30
MARTNAAQTRITPEKSELLTVRVVRRERLSPSFMRVTLGGDELTRFSPLGRDQWFRLFLPVAEGSLARLPHKLDTLAYVRYLAIAKTQRPVLRNYTVAGFRAEGREGPEMDVDFVLHGSAEKGGVGPAARWAESCSAGDAVALIDEGVIFSPPADRARPIVLVADETALPALAGILASLPADAVGHALVEVPDAGDVRELPGPGGVAVRWIVRPDSGAAPGSTVREEACALPVDPAAFGWVAGEQVLATSMRRHWVRSGLDKRAVSFTGYWRAPRS